LADSRFRHEADILGLFETPIRYTTREQIAMRLPADRDVLTV